MLIESIQFCLILFGVKCSSSDETSECKIIVDKSNRFLNKIDLHGWTYGVAVFNLRDIRSDVTKCHILEQMGLDDDCKKHKWRDAVLTLVCSWPDVAL